MKIAYRRTLPHLQPPSGQFFVTFRLKDSLPESILQEYRAERDRRLASTLNDQKAAYDEKKRLFAVFDSYLDRCLDVVSYLKEATIAQIMAEVILGRDGQSYYLLAYCIMPNHVHIVLELAEQGEDTFIPLFQIIGSMKRYSAKLINRSLNRSGAFWQQESYDHLIRDTAELKRIIRYVLLNPVNAGMVERWEDWPYSYVAEDIKAEFA